MRSYPILNTKLYKPVIKKHYVFRKEIIYTLEKNKSNQFTLVLAPTGYGKSVTVSEWLDCTKIKYCWISLDEKLNDLHIFLWYLVNAVKSVFKDSLSVLSDLLTATEIPNENVLSKYLINELDELEEELILVLDDYHLVKNQQIHNLINELIKYPPQGFHLVIISRRDPPLDLSSVKSFDQVNEIRMSELGFSKSEILSLAKSLQKSQIDDSIADILLKRTEGWIVGLRLAMLAFDENKNIINTLEEIKGDRHYFTQYLLNEVFLRQDDDIKKLLLTASVLDRINKELLLEIVTDTSGDTDNPNLPALDQLFDRFQESTLFIIPLDQEGIWYRYHHFFREFLLKQLEKHYSRNQITNFHRKASSYFEKQNLFEEAIHHSVSANDVSKAISIIVKQKDELLDKEHFNRLWKWLGMLPDGTVEKYPELLLTRALLADAVSGYASMQKDIVAAKVMLEQEKSEIIELNSNSLWAEFYAVQSCLSYISGDITSAGELSGKALSTLSPKQLYHRYFTSAYRAFSLYVSGHSNDADRFITKEVEEATKENRFNRYRLLNIQSMLFAFQGNLSNLKSSALQYQSICLKEQIWTPYVLSNYFLGETLYQRNKPDEAISLFESAEKYKYVSRPMYISACMIRKSFCLQLMNRTDELELYLKQIDDYAANLEHQTVAGLVNAFRVELALRNNNYDDACEFNDRANYDVYPPLFNFWFPQLTFIKFLLMSEDHNKLNEAEDKLNQLIEFGRSTFRNNLLLQALPLQSLLLHKKGDRIRSMEIFNEALTLSKPEGYIRNFLDLGEQINEMLDSVYKNDHEDKYRCKLLAEFKKENELSEKVKTKGKSLSLAGAENGSIMLSDRDVQLLTFLSKGFRNKEIAEKLNLSTASIKKYLVSVYQKLEVQNRAGAVAKANSLNLISN